MKNSHPFPGPKWVEDDFLSAPQRTACRALFLGQTTEMALATVDLSRLADDLALRGQELTANYLDPVEQDRLDSLTFAKRRHEWLGGRVAAKHAGVALLAKGCKAPQSYRELRVEPDQTGRPHLTWSAGASALLPAVSISHSSGYAGALAVRGSSCGLDLQRITPRVISVCERFATPAEMALTRTVPGLEDQGEATLLTLIWSAKESLRKAIVRQPLVGFTELCLCRLEGDRLTGMVGHFSCPGLAWPLSPVFLAIREEMVCAITVTSVVSPNPPESSQCRGRSGGVGLAGG